MPPLPPIIPPIPIELEDTYRTSETHFRHAYVYIQKIQYVPQYAYVYIQKIQYVPQYHA